MSFDRDSKGGDALPAPDAAERAAIVAEWRRQAAEDLPPNVGPVGCAVSLVAGAALLLVPRLISSPGPARVAAAAFAVLMVAGFIVSQFGGSGGRGVMRARVERALAALKGGGGADARRAAAVALLSNACESSGPSSSPLYDAAETRALLGSALPYVQSVERVLRDELNIAPVFTVKDA
jgi:hypothetical protein